MQQWKFQVHSAVSCFQRLAIFRSSQLLVLMQSAIRTDENLHQAIDSHDGTRRASSRVLPAVLNLHFSRSSVVHVQRFCCHIVVLSLSEVCTPRNLSVCMFVVRGLNGIHKHYTMPTAVEVPQSQNMAAMCTKWQITGTDDVPLDS